MWGNTLRSDHLLETPPFSALRNTAPGTKKAAAGPSAAQQSRINDHYEGYGKKTPSCPKREYQNSVSLTGEGRTPKILMIEGPHHRPSAVSLTGKGYECQELQLLE